MTDHSKNHPLSDKDISTDFNESTQPDSDSGLATYRGFAGPGDIEITYDSNEYEIVNGRLSKIDICS
jgi:hypothetical protein